MKSVIFDSETIRSILKGESHLFATEVDKDIIYQWDCENDGTPIAYIDQATGDSYSPTYPCRYKIGDILYVKETWAMLWSNENTNTKRFVYKATDSYPFGEKYIVKFKWRSPIYMPKEAARIFLQVVEVTLKLLQNKWAWLVKFEVVNNKGE